MPRSLGLVAAVCVSVALASPVFAQGADTTGRGRGEQPAARGRGEQGRGVTPEVREQLRTARQRLQRDTDEAKRLEEDVKAAKSSKDRARVQEDQEKLKIVRDRAKQDRETIKQIQQAHGLA